MAWRLANSLEKLRSQVNAAWPDRSKLSDGTIGDTSHAASKSDHNPNAAGVVTAMDITHDPAHGADMNRLSANLVASRDKRIKYLIWNGRIVSSSVNPWVWRTYDGSNPHDKHMHVSVLGEPALYDNTDLWRIRAVVKPPKHTPPWQLIVDGEGKGEGRLSNPAFLLKIKRALAKHGKIVLREKP